MHPRYLHTKFSQYDNNSRVPTCLRVQCTFSASVPVLTTTSVPGFTKTTATIRVMKVIPDLPVKLNNCPSSSQNMKTDSQQKFPVSFQVPIKTISTSYTVQVVSIDLIHALLKHFHNCSSNHGCYLMHLRNQDQHSQTGGVYMLSLYQSVVNQQSQHQVPPCIQCHDGSYFSLSLSQHSSAYTARQNHTASGFTFKVTSANVRQAPLFLHTTEPQVFSYSRLISKLHKLLISHMWQSNSLMNQGH